MRRALALLGWIAACGGTHESTPPDAQGVGAVVGTVAGSPIAVADAVVGCGLLAGSPTTHVDLFNIAEACTTIATSWPDGEQWLSFDLVVLDSTNQLGPGTTVGDYAVISDDPVDPGNYVAAEFQGAAVFPLGTAGSVHVSSVSASGVSGTFAVTMSTGDALTGWFDAPSCANVSPPGAVHNGGLYACP